MGSSLGNSSNNQRWFDVDPLLDATCGAMHCGELIHLENFSFFEAMSSVSLMDPKMDAGMDRGGSDGSGAVHSSTVDDLIHQGRAPLQLSGRDLCDVVDQLMACEATWHNGHSLAQTIFTCLYMHHPARTASHSVLGAICSGLRASVYATQVRN
jgi:hypothetical protein